MWVLLVSQVTNIKTFREKKYFLPPLSGSASLLDSLQFSVSLFHPRHISPAFFLLWISLGPLGAATRSAGVGVRMQQFLSASPSFSLFSAPAQVLRGHSPFENTCCSLEHLLLCPAVPSAFLTLFFLPSFLPVQPFCPF